MTLKLGICGWSIPAEGAAARIQMAAAAGLGAVELDMGKYEDGLPLSQPEVQVEYTALREQWGIVYPALAVNALCDYGMSVPADRPVVEEAISKAVDTALALDIPILQLPSFVKGFITDKAGFQSTVECLRFACECARGTDLIVGSENAISTEDQFRLMDAVGYDNFRLYFDTRNPFAMGGFDSAAMLETLLPHICEVHIKDGIDDGPAVPLGEGNSGLFDSLRVLRQHNYAGWLLLENSYSRMAQARDVEARTLLEKDIETIREFFAKG